MLGISVAFHAVRSPSLRCLCGSHEVFARPGPFSFGTALLGFVRYSCRSCRRTFWLRRGVGGRRQAKPNRRGGGSAPKLEPTLLDSAVGPIVAGRQQAPPSPADLDAALTPPSGTRRPLALAGAAAEPSGASDPTALPSELRPGPDLAALDERLTEIRSHSPAIPGAELAAARQARRRRRHQGLL